MPDNAIYFGGQRHEVDPSTIIHTAETCTITSPAGRVVIPTNLLTALQPPNPNTVRYQKGWGLYMASHSGAPQVCYRHFQNSTLRFSTHYLQVISQNGTIRCTLDLEDMASSSTSPQYLIPCTYDQHGSFICMGWLAETMTWDAPPAFHDEEDYLDDEGAQEEEEEVPAPQFSPTGADNDAGGGGDEPAF